MYRHWAESHQDGEKPKFVFKLIKSFPDALSRQIAESVRIDMRGGQVLNSKTVYSRCRLPRLTVEKQEWELREEERDRRVMDDTLVEKETDWEGGGAACDMVRDKVRTKRKIDELWRLGDLVRRGGNKTWLRTGVDQWVKSK